MHQDISKIEKSIAALKEEVDRMEALRLQKIEESNPVNYISAAQAKKILKKYIAPAFQQAKRDIEIKFSLEDIMLVANPDLPLELTDKLNSKLFKTDDDFFTTASRLKQSAKEKELEARAAAGSLETGIYIIPGRDAPIEKTKIESNEFLAAVCEYGVAKMRSFRDEDLSNELLKKKQKINSDATKRRFVSDGQQSNG